MKIPEPPKISLTARRNGKNGWALSTYDSVWVKDKTGADGRLIKGHARQKNLHVVGHIDGGNREGWVVWRDRQIIRDYPELEYYEMYRKGGKNYFFPKSQLQQDDGTAVPGVKLDGELIAAPAELNHAWLHNDSTSTGSGDTADESSDDSSTAGTRSSHCSARADRESARADHGAARKGRGSARTGRQSPGKGSIIPEQFAMSGLQGTAAQGHILAVKNAAAHAVFASATRTGLAQAVYEHLGKRAGSHVMSLVARTVLTGELNVQDLESFVYQYDLPVSGGITSTAFVNSLKKIDQDKVRKILRQYAGNILSSKSSDFVFASGSNADLNDQSDFISPHQNNYDLFGKTVLNTRQKYEECSEHTDFDLLTTTEDGSLPLTFILGKGSCDYTAQAMQSLNELGVEGTDDLLFRMLYVADNTGADDELIDTLLNAGQSFLLNCRDGSRYRAAALAEALKETPEFPAVNAPSCFSLFDKYPTLIGYRLVILEKGHESAATADMSKVNDTGTKLYCHVFYDTLLKSDKVRRCIDLVNRATTDLIMGKELSKDHRIALLALTNYQPEKHLPQSEEARQIRFVDTKLEETARNFGFDVLITDDGSMSAQEARTIYKNIRHVKLANLMLKGNMNNRRLGARTEAGVLYRAFVAFCAAVIECDLANHITEARVKCLNTYPDYLNSVPELLRQCHELSVYVYDNEQLQGKIYSDCTDSTKAAFAVAGLNIS